MNLQNIYQQNLELDFDILKSDRELAKQIQSRLIDLGLLVGIADGLYGIKTESALERFARIFDLPCELNKQLSKNLIECKELPNNLENVKLIANALDTQLIQVQKYYPSCLQEFRAKGMGDRSCVIAMLATVRVETGGFQPIDEYGGVEYFTQMYEGRADLGNIYTGDGARYHGRGFIQITGRINYREYSNKLKVDLEGNPDLALDATIAAKLLAFYFKDRFIDNASRSKDWRKIRKLTNGGHNGWNDFIQYIQKCEEIL